MWNAYRMMTVGSSPSYDTRMLVMSLICSSALLRVKSTLLVLPVNGLFSPMLIVYIYAPIWLISTASSALVTMRSEHYYRDC